MIKNLKNFIAWIKSKIHKVTAPNQAQPSKETPTSSIEAKVSHHDEPIDAQDISNRRDFLSKAIVGGAGIVAGGGAVAGTSMNSAGITFDDGTSQVTALPDPAGEAGKVLKSDGAKAEWMESGSSVGSALYITNGNYNRGGTPFNCNFTACGAGGGGGNCDRTRSASGGGGGAHASSTLILQATNIYWTLGVGGSGADSATDNNGNAGSATTITITGGGNGWNDCTRRGRGGISGRNQRHLLRCGWI